MYMNMTSTHGTINHYKDNNDKDSDVN